MVANQTKQFNLSQLIGPSFYDIYWDYKLGLHSNYILSGGRGSLKSSFWATLIGLEIPQDPEFNAVVLRKVKETLRKSAFAEVKKVINRLGQKRLWKATTNPMELTYIPTGQKIIFLGCDDPEDVKGTTVETGYFKLLVFEEAYQFAGMAEIRSVKQTLARGGDDIKTILAFNPPESNTKWINVEAPLQAEREDTLLHKSDYRTVPKEWLGKEFLAEAEYLRKVNEKKWLHEYLGEATGTGAEVFKNVQARAMSDEMIASFETILHGIDFGYSSDPFVYLRAHYDEYRQELYIFDEIYEVGLENTEAAKLIKKKNPRNEPITADNQEVFIQILNKEGLRVYPAIKGNGSRDPGYKWLQDLNAIYIDPERCPNAYLDMSTYELKRTKTGKFKPGYPQGVGYPDHVQDALRYMLEEYIRLTWVETDDKPNYIP